jgi:outer membrane protein
LRTYRLLLPLLALGAIAASAQTDASPVKVGVINIQQAIVSTKDGQTAATALQSKFDPTRKELEGMQGEIASLRDQLSKGSNTMSEDAKQNLMRQIDDRTRQYNRRAEDAQAEFEAEQQRLLGDLGQKIMTVIDKYSRDNGYAVILDVSNPQTPVLFASNTIDITKQVIELYDQNAPAPAAAAPASQAPPSAANPVPQGVPPAASPVPQAPPAPKPAAPKK